ncbi:SOS response-associated peptidase [Ammoniphilus sp. 3BR4]|uniref:SOS response-associated peptidase n=1 Tax=Ammoniphilus sp. 3BR4 TaxID=3158265 RepID=UPI0034677C27
MCGRFTLTVTLEELMLRFGVAEWAGTIYQPRYNIAPMQMIFAIVNDGKKNRLGQLRWGLVPSWAKDEKMAGKMINARSETILEKASFQSLIHRKRCIVPADSFYEWKVANGKKHPIRFMVRGEDIFSLAGLYDTWINPADGQKVSTCTIITTSPNPLVADVHNRMPVILKKQDEAKWLDRSNTSIEELVSLLTPYPQEGMYAYPVSPIVGNVKNDIPDCIAKVD